MPRDSILFLFSFIFFVLSWNAINCEEEKPAGYDINQGVLYKKFLEELFLKYDPVNKK